MLLMRQLLTEEDLELKERGTEKNEKPYYGTIGSIFF